MYVHTGFAVGLTICMTVVLVLEVRTRAISELMAIMGEGARVAWEAADLGERLRVWWREVRNPERAGQPTCWTHPLANLNDRQLTVIALANRTGQVTSADLQNLFAYHPETLRQDLADLVANGILEKHSKSRGTFYTPSPVNGTSRFTSQMSEMSGQLG